MPGTKSVKMPVPVYGGVPPVAETVIVDPETDEVTSIAGFTVSIAAFEIITCPQESVTIQRYWPAEAGNTNEMLSRLDVTAP